MYKKNEFYHESKMYKNVDMKIRISKNVLPDFISNLLGTLGVIIKLLLP